MFLIFMSLLTGFLGLAIGGPILGIVGFLSPTIFLIQRIYTMLESLLEINISKSHKSIENSNENETVLDHDEICPSCGTKNDENEQHCIGCGLKLRE